MARKRANKRAARPVSKTRVAELIEQATVDCFNNSEARTGFLTMIGDGLALPFTTTILGAQVEVIAIDLRDDESIVAICRRGKERQRIPILDLPLPSPPPAGSEWIEAYRAWIKGDW